MPSYIKVAMNAIGKYIFPYLEFFSDLKKDLKRSRMKITLEEYMSTAVFTCLLLFVIELPVFAFIFSLLQQGILFSLIMGFTLSSAISASFFLIFINYPKFVIRDKAKSIENSLPFAGVYLSTIASSNLPPHKIFEIFAKFKEYGEISKESERIVTDMKAFGLTVYDSLEKAVDRTPSKDLRELFWSMVATLRTGGDLAAFLTEKSKSLLSAHRRKLNEFSHSLTIYLEIYLTALILGSIFFTILTSIMSGLGGVTTTSIISIQFFLIFIFIPLVSFGFIILIKSASPGVD